MTEDLPRPSDGQSVSEELAAKLAAMRLAIERHRLGGIRLRGQDWFAWATCGGSNVVLLASERGVADVLVTRTRACVLADTIDGPRLRVEELPADLELVEFGWERPAEREEYAREVAGGQSIASDVPSPGESALPAELIAEKRRLHATEIVRYRELGRDAAMALTETLGRVTPTMTELEVAGIGCDAMLRRRIDPALVLVAGASRVDKFRHPRPTTAHIGDRVEVVFCARRFGLYANLTRFGYFRTPTADELARANAVAQVEATALDASQPHATLGSVYAAIVDAYTRQGHPGAQRGHHQGGTTGYLSREEIARPGSVVEIAPPIALAWNPSLPGSKIEDTVLRTVHELEVLTVDPAWPTLDIEGRARPALRILA